MKMSKKILKTTKKADLRIKVDKVSEDLKKEMKVWYHPKLQNGAQQDNNSKKSKHLRNDHQIHSVGETTEFAKLFNHQIDLEGENCECEICKNIINQAKCENLSNCILHAQSLINKLDPKWKPDTGKEKEESDWRKMIKLRNSQNNTNTNDTNFAIIEKQFIARNKKDIFRILGSKTRQQTNPKKNTVKENNNNTTEHEMAYTDRSCINNGQEDA
jgi:hypothetical protein